MKKTPWYIDSIIFAAMHRKRLYWCNIERAQLEEECRILQEYLDKNSERIALYEKISCITGNSNSYLQGNLTKPLILYIFLHKIIK